MRAFKCVNKRIHFWETQVGLPNTVGTNRYRPQLPDPLTSSWFLKNEGWVQGRNDMPAGLNNAE